MSTREERGATPGRWRVVWLRLGVGVGLVGLGFGLAQWLGGPAEDPAPLDEPADASGETVPTLQGRAPLASDTVVANLPTIEDPVRYVLDGLWEIPEAHQQAHLHALIDRDPAFLQALVDWVVHPEEHPSTAVQRSRSQSIKNTLRRVLATVGRRAVPPLVSIFEGEDADRGYEAARALGAMGEHATGAAPNLLAVAQDEERNKHLRAMAIEALGFVPDPSGRATVFVSEELLDPNCLEQIGLACASALPRMGALEGPALEAARFVVRDDWHVATRTLLQSMSQYGERAAPLVPAVLDACAEEGTVFELRSVLTNFIRASGDRSPDVIAFLERSTRMFYEAGEYAHGMVELLGESGSRGHDALFALSDVGTTAQRLEVFSALARGGADEERLLALAPRIAESDPRQARNVLHALKVRKPDAEATLRHLGRWMRSDPKQDATTAERRALHEALGLLRHVSNPTPAVRDLLLRGVDHPRDGAAGIALEALIAHADVWPDLVFDKLRSLGAADRDYLSRRALEGLASFIDTRGEEVRALWVRHLPDHPSSGALLALLAEHFMDRVAVRELCRRHADGEEPAQVHVAVAALAKAALPGDFARLESLAGSVSALGSWAARKGLVHYLDTERFAVLAAWMKVARGNHGPVSHAAIRLLQKAGAKAEPVVEDLVRLRDSATDEGLRRSLTWAIHAIRREVALQGAE